MEVKYIKSNVCDAADVPLVLDRLQVEYQQISNVNWPNEFPYCPKVEFRIAYTNQSILLHYKVEEESCKATYSKDNDQVWTDSCVEFFSIPGNDGIYYNLECNCIGTVLLKAGRDRNNREAASQFTLDTIQRWSSLGRKPFELKTGGVKWEVALIVPFKVFFKHNVHNLSATSIKANFYKCGDNLPIPHFLSWNPIQLDKPNFHCPEFFGDISFQSFS